VSENVKAAIIQAAMLVRSAVEKEPHKEWDYLVVAVPVNCPAPVRIQMVTSVPTNVIPRFLEYVGGNAQAGTPS